MVHAVNMPLFTPSKKGQGDFISRIIYGLRLLGCQGHGLHCCLKKGQTMNGEYYANLLRQLQKTVRIYWPGRLKKLVTLHLDNAAALKSTVACATVGTSFWIILHIGPTSTIRLLQLPQYEETLAWASLQYKWWSNCCSKVVFWGPRSCNLHYQNLEIAAPIGYVCCMHRGLYWYSKCFENHVSHVLKD